MADTGIESSNLLTKQFFCQNHFLSFGMCLQFKNLEKNFDFFGEVNHENFGDKYTQSVVFKNDT